MGTTAPGATSTSTQQSAYNKRLSPELQANNLSGNLEVIVQYIAAPTAVQAMSAAGLGGTVHQTFIRTKAAHTTIPASQLKMLLLDPTVKYVSPDRPTKGHLSQGDVATNANLAYQFSVNGAGVGVAVIDSGIGPHPDLTNVVYEQNFVDTVSYDEYGHGTAVASVIAGSGVSSSGSQFTSTFQGAAQGVSLIDLRNSFIQNYNHCFS